MTMLMLKLTYENLVSEIVAINQNIGNGEGSINEDHVENSSRTIPIPRSRRNSVLLKLQVGNEWVAVVANEKIFCYNMENWHQPDSWNLVM